MRTSVRTHAARLLRLDGSRSIDRSMDGWAGIDSLGERRDERHISLPVAHDEGVEAITDRSYLFSALHG